MTRYDAIEKADFDFPAHFTASAPARANPSPPNPNRTPPTQLQPESQPHSKPNLKAPSTPNPQP